MSTHRLGVAPGQPKVRAAQKPHPEMINIGQRPPGVAERGRASLSKQLGMSRASGRP
ncbi:MAG: hypothetical protein JOZ09_16770 [Pseudonocardiales bacterium]|nr:hypothetical protein [Pseudonocardiales bacterium]